MNMLKKLGMSKHVKTSMNVYNLPKAAAQNLMGGANEAAKETACSATEEPRPRAETGAVTDNSGTSASRW